MRLDELEGQLNRSRQLVAEEEKKYAAMPRDKRRKFRRYIEVVRAQLALLEKQYLKTVAELESIALHGEDGHRAKKSETFKADFESELLSAVDL